MGTNSFRRLRFTFVILWTGLLLPSCDECHVKEYKSQPPSLVASKTEDKAAWNTAYEQFSSYVVEIKKTGNGKALREILDEKLPASLEEPVISEGKDVASGKTLPALFHLLTSKEHRGLIYDEMSSFGSVPKEYCFRNTKESFIIFKKSLALGVLASMNDDYYLKWLAGRSEITPPTRFDVYFGLDFCAGNLHYEDKKERGNSYPYWAKMLSSKSAVYRLVAAKGIVSSHRNKQELWDGLEKMLSEKSTIFQGWAVGWLARPDISPRARGILQKYAARKEPLVNDGTWVPWWGKKHPVLWAREILKADKKKKNGVKNSNLDQHKKTP